MRLRNEDLWFRVYGLGCGVQGLWFMVFGLCQQGLWFMVFGLCQRGEESVSTHDSPGREGLAECGRVTSHMEKQPPPLHAGP